MRLNNIECILVDFDNTIIYTDKANFLSYKEAFEKKYGKQFLHNSKNRFTKNELIKNFYLNKDKVNEIVDYKNKIYKKYIIHTKVNYGLLALLLDIKIPIYICTNANCDRVKLLIDYHKLFFYKDIFFNKNGNKFENCIKKYNIDLSAIIVFEDDEREIKNALKIGILKENIFKIGNKNEN